MNILEHLKAGGQVQMRDGRPVKIYTTEHVGECPLVGRIEGSDYVWTWTPDGSLCEGEVHRDHDLVPVPRKFRIERWLNVNWHRDPMEPYCTSGYATPDDAAAHAPSSRIACVKVVLEGEYGEGL